MIRRFLHLYWRFSRGMTLGVRGAVEPGESLVEALARELMEEGNLRIAAAPPLHGVFHNAGASRRNHVAVFVVREFEWPAPPRASWEIPQAGFFPLNKLPDGTSEGTRRRLEEILYGAPI